MKIKGNFSATGNIPEFVSQYNTLIEHRGDEPLFKFTLREYDTINRYYEWRASNPLQELKKPEEPKRYLTRHDMSALLRLSLVTVDKYTRLGTLQGQKIGNRILYAPEEAERALQAIAANTFRK